MSAIPRNDAYSAQATRIRAHVVARRRVSAVGGFFRFVAWVFFLTVVLTQAGGFIGFQMIEMARQGARVAKERAGRAELAAQKLRTELAEFAAPARIEEWASAHGFRPSLSSESGARK
ncbi:MAG: hypothetical protein AKCLJLPJ_00298 [Fimbriimonadales bacterium]|nr:hypothetical protein [Fimbriimonadales bacterium]